MAHGSLRLYQILAVSQPGAHTGAPGESANSLDQRPLALIFDAARGTATAMRYRSARAISAGRNVLTYVSTPQDLLQLPVIETGQRFLRESQFC